VADAAGLCAAIEKASNSRVLGYRYSGGGLGFDQLWVLAALAKAGLVYDSSFGDAGMRTLPVPYRRPHRHAFDGKEIHEIPVPATTILGKSVCISDSSLLRNLPFLFVKSRIRNWRQSARAPWMLRLQIQDLQTSREANSTRQLLRRVLDSYRLVSIEQYLSQSGMSAGRTRDLAVVPAPQARNLMAGAEAAKIPC